MVITIPGIVITMTPESIFRSFRNGHHDHFGIAIIMPRNPHNGRMSSFGDVFLACSDNVAVVAYQHTLRTSPTRSFR